jgi:hypothetical protein
MDWAGVRAASVSPRWTSSSMVARPHQVFPTSVAVPATKTVVT